MTQETNWPHSAFDVGSNKIWDSINQGVRLMNCGHFGHFKHSY